MVATEIEVGPTLGILRGSGGIETQTPVVVGTEEVTTSASVVAMLGNGGQRSKSSETNCVRSSARSRTCDTELAAKTWMHGGTLGRSWLSAGYVRGRTVIAAFESLTVHDVGGVGSFYVCSMGI